MPDSSPLAPSLPLRYRLPAFYLQRMKELSAEAMARPAELPSTFESDWDQIDKAHAEILAGLGDDEILRRFCVDYARSGALLLLRYRGADTATEWLEPAVDCARNLGQSRSESTLLGYLAEARLTLGDHEGATASGREALAVLDRIGDEDAGRRAELHHLLGRAYRDAGSNEAESIYRRALDLARRHDDPCLEGRILVDLGNIRANRGHYAEGLERYDQAAGAMARGDCRDPRDEAKRQGFIGNARRNLGEYDEAITAYEKAIELYRSVGDLRQLGVQSFNLALAQRDRGRFAEQRSALEVAFDSANKSRDDRGAGKALNGLGTYYAYSGDYETAVNHHRRGFGLVASARFIAAYVQTDLAVTHLLYGQPLRALDVLFPALEVAVERDHALLQLQRRTLIARSHLERGETASALEQIERAREGETDPSTAASRHLTAALHGVMLVRRSTDSLRKPAREAFRRAIDFASEVRDYTAPYVTGLGHAGLATTSETAVDRQKAIDAAIGAYRRALERCAVAKVVEDHLALLDALAEGSDENLKKVLRPVRSVLVAALPRGAGD